MRASTAVALCFLMSACAQQPQCDYTSSTGACSASIDTVGNRVIVKAERCSEVDIEVAGKRRAVRPAEGGKVVSDTETLVDIKACRLFKELPVAGNSK